MYLSYSGYAVALQCLFKYWNTYVHRTDVGPQDRLSSIFGSTLGRLVELFYKNKMWREKGTARKRLEGLAPRVLDQIIEQELDPNGFKGPGFIGWKSEAYPEGKYASREDLLSDILTHIPKVLKIIQYHKLVGVDADAEVGFKINRNGHIIDGRADFTMTQHTSGDYIILDGKATEYGDKYLDVDQLVWYAALALEKSGRLPAWVAFILWRKYEALALIKHTVTEEQAKDMLQAALDMANLLESKTQSIPVVGFNSLAQAKETFPPTKSRECLLCEYAKSGVCSEGQAHLLTLRRPS